MAGHSKWANIKHRKAIQDSRKNKMFTKIAREISVATKCGVINVADNPALRSAVEKALNANMSRDIINRAIKRGAGNEDCNNMEACTYEGYGANGVAVIVECLTDNKNRTASEVRHAFSKHNGNLGTDGSVAYLFSKRGQIMFQEDKISEEKIMDIALEAGAEDIINQEDGYIEVVTDWKEMLAIKDKLEDSGMQPIESIVSMIPSNKVNLDAQGAEKIILLIDHLEDLDDVQNVYTNAQISQEIMDQINR